MAGQSIDLHNNGPPSIIWIARYDPTLPRPWKGLIDPSTGWLYFWNPETNVTQYERPSAPLYYHQFQLQQYPYPWLPRYDRPQLQYSPRYPEPLSTSHAPICDSPSIPIAVRAPHPVTVNYPRYRSLIRERGVDRDRISELPDELICHILSFLPTISAVRTTLLSKRWNKLWTFVRHLDFDLNRDRPDGTFFFFERFVEFVFLRLVSLYIGKCRLRYTTASWVEYDFSHVDDWISIAVSRNVVELDLRIFDVHAGHLCRLPKSIFWCKTLKVLKLWIDYIDIPDPPTKGSFPNLKILHVTVTNPDDDELGKLLSYFPVVEDLSIHGQLRYSYMYYHNINLKVSFPELKTLKLSTEREERAYYEMGHDYGGTLNQYHFCVDAPKLENLDLVQIPLSNYILENPKSVVNASIAFKSLAEEEWSSFPDRAFQLLTGISNVKCLSLSDHPFEASNLPVFGNLKQLKLVLRNCSS